MKGGPMLDRRQLYRVVVALTVVGLAGAGFGTFMAWVIYAIECGEDTSDDCPPDDGPSSELTAQLWVAVAGLVFAVLTVYFTARKRKRRAIASLGGAVVLYALWGILNYQILHD
jgi:hypothetical protein